jgi:hypothetical protein
MMMRLAENSTEGRYYVATRPIGERALVMREDALVVGFPQAYLGRFCSWCIGRVKAGARGRGRACRECGVAVYCGEECQRRGEALHRSVECGVLATLHHKDEGRLGDLVESGFAFLDTGTVAQALCLARLGHGSLCEAPYPALTTKGERSLLRRVCEATSVPFDAAASCCSRVLCNCFALELPHRGSILRIGSGSYPRGSLFNHSCAPNIGFARVGREIVFFAARDIAAGDRMCINYVDLNLSLGERKRELREEYGFDCQCDRCASGSSLEQDIFGWCQSCSSAAKAFGVCSICAPNDLLSVLRSSPPCG